jgi:predicted flap endonuclease-1-like 5' DNA nuclease
VGEPLVCVAPADGVTPALAGHRGVELTGDRVMADRYVENDLANLKGIGPRYAEILKSIGVDSIKELRHRNPANLKNMIEERHGRVVGLSENECKAWIEEAKAYQS